LERLLANARASSSLNETREEVSRFVFAPTGKCGYAMPGGQQFGFLGRIEASSFSCLGYTNQIERSVSYYIIFRVQIFDQ
jgi:hypothetical protein